MISHIMKSDCGCQFEFFLEGGGEIFHWCPLHKAAPAMYEALKGLCLMYNIDKESIILNQDPEYWQRAVKALVKAEGK